MSPTRAAGLGILTGTTLLWVGIFNWSYLISEGRDPDIMGMALFFSSILCGAGTFLGVAEMKA